MKRIVILLAIVLMICTAALAEPAVDVTSFYGDWISTQIASAASPLPPSMTTYEMTLNVQEWFLTLNCRTFSFDDLTLLYQFEDNALTFQPFSSANGKLYFDENGILNMDIWSCPEDLITFAFEPVFTEKTFD